MKAALILLALVILNSADDSNNFKDWKKKQSKDSASSGKSETEAEKAFKKNVEAIKKHNEDPTATYKQGVNDVADTTKEERAYRRGLPGNDDDNATPAVASQQVRGKIPDSLTYLDKMSAVKSQGKCGAGWAFAAMAVMEYYSKKNGTNQIFSEQNVIDCQEKSKGCEGGNPMQAFKYAMESGISDGTKYKYIEKKQACQRSKFPKIYTWGKTCTMANLGNETNLKILLANNGPATVMIDASDTGLDFYKSGIFTSKNCSSDIKRADHTVTLVGYGTDAKAGDFWIARNSWGASWGEKGYFRIARGKNMCGIANKPLVRCPKLP